MEHPEPVICNELIVNESRLQHWLGSAITGGGVRVLTVGLQHFWRCAVKPSSRHSRWIFLRLISTPTPRNRIVVAGKRTVAAPCLQLIAYLPVVSMPRTLAHTCLISADYFTRLPLTHHILNLKMSNRVTLTDGR